jgi:2-polyprenyl-3-methyl-5-hydroxy-6-metoxy-1,4-benzoquinol methylase
MLRVLQFTERTASDPRTWRVLDVGCSIGTFAFSLASRVREVVGTDIEPEAIACANAWAHEENITNVMFYVDATSGITQNVRGPFDLIVVKEVIEHLGTPLKLISMLQDLKKLLSPDGRIYLETPNYLFPFEPHLQIVIPPLLPSRWIKKLAAFRNLHGASDDSFFKALLIQSPHRIAKIAREAGFTVIDAGAEVRLPEVIAGRQIKRSMGILVPFLRFARIPLLKRILISVARMTHAYPTVTFVLKLHETSEKARS